MVEIRRILCPTDFSETSRRALEHAIVIAGWYGSHISALHVGNPMIVLSTFVPVPPITSDALFGNSNRKGLEEEVRAWLSPATKAGLETDVIVDEGNPAARILEHARLLSADLIVLGTHGRGGLERMVLGSVAEKVVRKAKCPAMTVPPPAVGTSKPPFAHLLCPVDFSDSSKAALGFAFSLAQESNARLTVLHVFEWPSRETPARPDLETSDFHRQLQVETRQQLEALIPDDVRNWCTPEAKLAFGQAGRQILRVTVTDHVDLIVMGAHGRNAFELMLFGSTTNQVVREASCPVVTVRG